MHSQAFQLNCDSNAMQRFMLASISWLIITVNEIVLLFDHLRAKYNFVRAVLSSCENESQEGYMLNEPHHFFFIFF